MKAIKMTGKLLIYIMASFGSLSARAQSGDGTPFGSWLIPGVRYHFSERFELLAQQAWYPQQHISFSNVQGYFRLGRHTTLTSAFMFIDLPENQGIDRDQYTFLNGILWDIPVTKLHLEYRGLLWNRLINNGPDRHLLRNRARVICGTGILGKAVQFYVFDEITFNILTGMRDRNRIGPGITFDLLKELNLDLAMARQNDQRGGNTDLLFITLTCRLPFSDNHR